jgi:hypothetical protein
MAIRQIRIFVQHTEPDDWAETLIGRVIHQLVDEFAGVLRWFWFSRYCCLIKQNGTDDRDDCDFDAIPEDCKLAFPGSCNQRGHRSLRFRFEIEDSSQPTFEHRLTQLLGEYKYRFSSVLHYDQVQDTGGERLLGNENRKPGRDVQRAQLVTEMYHVISQLVIDALVGPDQQWRFQVETNDHDENPNASAFESLHHLFCNITNVPLSVLVGPCGQMPSLQTFWGSAYRSQPRNWKGQLFTEGFLKY